MAGQDDIARLPQADGEAHALGLVVPVGCLKASQLFESAPAGAHPRRPPGRQRAWPYFDEQVARRCCASCYNLDALLAER